MKAATKSLSLFRVRAESAKNLDVEVSGFPVAAEPEKAPREDGINVKFTRDEKEEIRRKSVVYNTGMSTIVHKAWTFFDEFADCADEMLRHKDHLKDVVKSLAKRYE